MATQKTPKKATKKSVKSATQKTPAVTEQGMRLRKLTRRQRAKQEKASQRAEKLPGAFSILGQSLKQLHRHKRVFFWILLIYGLLYVLFVKGISANFQLGNLKQNLTDSFNGTLGAFSTGVALYGLLLGTAGSGASESASVYQTVLVVVVSLAVIWALRYGDKTKITAKQSYYKGMQQLIPFLIVLFFIFLQALPALIVLSIFSVIQNSGAAVGSLQQGIAFAVLALGLFWTFYMLSSSLFAMYIVTLPGTYPRAALKAAKKLVRFRRFQILRKVVFLPLALLLFSAIVLIPLIIFIAPAAEVLFMVFTIALLAVIHSYMYTLYRSLL